MTRWTAILLAGTRPGGDPFAAAHNVAVKSLIPVGGVPMVRRVAETLLAAPEIAKVRVLAQEPGALADALPAEPELSFGFSDKSIAGTLKRVLDDPETRFPLFVTTSDHALLTPAMIAQFCRDAAGADLAIGLVEKSVMDAQLGPIARTWIKFRGGAYSGANLFAFGSADAGRAVDLWRGVEQDRKTGWKLVRSFGVGTLLGAALRLRSLDDTLARLGAKMKLDVRAVRMDDALAAVDIDKQADLVFAEQHLETVS